VTEGRAVEFFFDVGSPYSYLAGARMPGLARSTGATVHWRPFLLGAVFKATGNEMPARVQAKARWMLEDLLRWGVQLSVPFRFPSRFPLNTLRAQRALTAVARAQPNLLPAAAMALFSAYWVEDRDVSDDAVIDAALRSCDIDGARMLADAAMPEVKDLLRQWTDEAVNRGAFGAPTFFLGDAMYWGHDRIDMLESHLRASP